MKKCVFTQSIVLFLVFGIANVGQGQFNQNYSQSEIQGQIEKLGTIGSILYVAAHPDDENTNVISYYSNKKHLITNYLSMTRGDGGQNLIGQEISELLGVIRTQELLAARRIDGGNQYFTRTNDFGYSKNAEETLKIWDHDQALADVVWVIRKTQPDIIINRFDHETSGKTHGHHTSSAILAVEAFDLAADSTAFPEQLKYVDTWQAKRIFHNTSWWFYGSLERFKQENKMKMDSVNIGTFLPLLGASNSEISALSRSMHKCQGFGMAGSRGENYDYLILVKGDETGTEGPLAGINTSLNRLEPSGKLSVIFNNLRENYKRNQWDKSLQNLLEFIELVETLDDSYYKTIKLEQANALMKNITGLFMLASVSEKTVTPGDSIQVTLEFNSRNSRAIKIKRIKYRENELLDESLKLDRNQSSFHHLSLKVPDDIEYSTPYWLQEEWDMGMYTVTDQKLRGQAENDPALLLQVEVTLNGKPFQYDIPIIYKGSDPVYGEVRQPLAIIPAITMNIEQPVYVFSGSTPKTISINVRAWKDKVDGKPEVHLPKGWVIKGLPETMKFKEKGDENRLELQLIPPAEASEGEIEFSFLSSDGKFNQKLNIIDYPHIPTQYVLGKSSSRIVKLNLKKHGEIVGYIDGAGDQIPFALEQMGYDVKMLSDEEILMDRLDKYDAIITGIRAYNTNKRIGNYQPHLMKYVENGGTMIVQYVTVRGMNIEEIGPYPIQLSHERISEEDAELRFLAPEHPVLNTPNKITQADFDGWVQERGLYFATTWDDRYTPILAGHDKGEPDRAGGMLVTKYGKGYYIYSGYSWFRELPAGIPGAYRLFANMVSLGNNKK